MSRYDKLLFDILCRTKDNNISFAELQLVLETLGFKEQIKGDHHIYTKDGVDEIINIQPKENMAKPYQVRQVRNLILKYKLEKVTMYKYEVILYWSKEDESYIAEVPELPGCMADGKTMSEALENVHTVMNEWLETARQLGRDIPEPKGKLAYA